MIYCKQDAQLKSKWFLPGKRSNFHTTFERKIVSLLVTLTGCGLVDDETKIKNHASQTGSLQESGSYVKGWRFWWRSYCLKLLDDWFGRMLFPWFRLHVSVSDCWFGCTPSAKLWVPYPWAASKRAKAHWCPASTGWCQQLKSLASSSFYIHVYSYKLYIYI